MMAQRDSRTAAGVAIVVVQGVMGMGRRGVECMGQHLMIMWDKVR